MRSSPRTSPSLGEVLDFMRDLWALDHALHTRSKHMARRLGVTGPQRLVIRLVGRFPALSPGELAELMHVHPSTLTGILDRLEKRRLIERWPDPQDSRRALLRITAQGRRVNARAAGTVEAAVRAALARQSPAQVRAARQVLAAVRGTLEVPPPPPSPVARDRLTSKRPV